MSFKSVCVGQPPKGTRSCLCGWNRTSSNCRTRISDGRAPSQPSPAGAGYCRPTPAEWHGATSTGWAWIESHAWVPAAWTPWTPSNTSHLLWQDPQLHRRTLSVLRLRWLPSRPARVMHIPGSWNCPRRTRAWASTSWVAKNRTPPSISPGSSPGVWPTAMGASSVETSCCR